MDMDIKETPRRPNLCPARIRRSQGHTTAAEKTQADDLEYFRSRERRVTEQMVANFPEPKAVTYFWTMGSNLADHPEFSALTEDELHAALAQRGKAVMKPGPDGVLASEYIKRVHSFDPDDPITAAIVRYL
jgi:hypothetical protein